MTAPIEPTDPSNLFSPFLPATILVPNEPDRMRTFLLDKLSNMSDVINDKMIGSWTQNTQNFSGATFTYDTTKKSRQGYQIIARIKSFVPQTIPNPISTVNPQLIMTHVYGTASKPCTAIGANNGDYFSFFSQGDARIQFDVSDTQIVITTNGTTSAYQGFIILSYIHDGV